MTLVHDRYRVDPRARRVRRARFDRDAPRRAARSSGRRKARRRSSSRRSRSSTATSSTASRSATGTSSIATAPARLRGCADGARRAARAEERHAKAAEAYRRVLARDELHEEALRALMKRTPPWASARRRSERTSASPTACARSSRRSPTTRRPRSSRSCSRGHRSERLQLRVPSTEVAGTRHRLNAPGMRRRPSAGTRQVHGFSVRVELSGS